MLNLNQRHQGERFIIGGSSPNIHNLDPFVLNTGVVIGINRWYRIHPCYYWICADKAENAWRDFGKDIMGIDAIRFLVKPQQGNNPLPSKAAHYWFHATEHESVIQPSWNGSLYTWKTTATAAAHLAIIMGASEILLYGVDLMGDTRFDGSQGLPNYWERHHRKINRSFQLLSQHVPIYKTNPDSPLDLPFMDLYQSSQPRLNVVTVKTGTGYTADYVNRMFSMVRRNLQIPFDFYCLTENPEGLAPDIQPIHLHEVLPRWWNKMFLFSDLIPTGPMLYLDLDQVITGNITEIVTECLKYPFSCYADHIEWHGVKLGTAMMTFNPADFRHVFEGFWADREQIMHEFYRGGDQVYLGPILPEPYYIGQDFPEAVKSYKWDLRDKGLTPDKTTRIVNFHGRPKPRQVDEPWVREYWQ
jgi:hypothetical protein